MDRCPTCGQQVGLEHAVGRVLGLVVFGILAAGLAGLMVLLLVLAARTLL